MQCSCGGEAVTIISKRAATKAEFRYSECRSCKRISDGSLFVQGIEVLKEGHAGEMDVREAFQHLDQVSAERLYDDAIEARRQTSADSGAAAGAPETGSALVPEQAAFAF